MKILFLVYHGFSEVSGITKKIRAQVKGLEQCGHEVHLCYYDFSAEGHRCRFVDGQVLCDYGRGLLAGLRQRTSYGAVLDYCRQCGISLIYARCFQNASPFLIAFFRRLRRAGIVAVTEVPTYPYDHEFDTFGLQVRLELKIDQLFRRRLYREMAAMVTFSDAPAIFGQRTIRISNGVDFDALPLHRYVPSSDGAVHLIGVAEVHLWHGFDRLMAGMGEYYARGGQRRVVFHVVGGVADGEMHGRGPYPGFAPIISRYGLQQHVVFHGQLFGGALDDVFDRCCFAIGSLARHRSGITVIKTLKNREYACRGIPFVYSETDSDFDGQPYVLKVPADETPVDLAALLAFIDSYPADAAAIRKSVAHLSWQRQMGKVVEEVMCFKELRS